MHDINVVSTGTHGNGITYFDREILTAQYERAQANGGYLTREDADKILTESERLGYGASTGSVYELDGHYYCRCHRYNNCD